MYAEGYYWLTSERSSVRGVAQYLGGYWYLVNEEGPHTTAEVEQRGWNVGEFIGGANVR